MRNHPLLATRLLGIALLAAACDTVKSPAAADIPPKAPDAPAYTVTPDVAGVVVNPAGLAVDGATVQAIDGPAAGRSTTTDENGRFLLAGVQGAQAINVRVVRDGYRELTVPGPAAARVVLSTAGEPLAPKYVLSLTAAPACTGLPVDVRARNYDAVLLADVGAGTFTMPLSGANFYPTQRVAWGGVELESNMKFVIMSWEAAERWMDDLPIVESLGDGRYLSVGGIMAARLTHPTRSLTSTFEGRFSYCARGAANDIYFECAVPPVECRSSIHQLTLVPK